MAVSEELKSLYKKSNKDEKITEFIDGNGVSIIRRYDNNTLYFKDNRRMLVSLVISKGYLVGDINMISNYDGERKSYPIVSEKKYNNTFTNFSFGKQDGIVYHNKKFIDTGTGKKFTLNEIIDVIIDNHISPKTLTKIKYSLTRMIRKFILKIIFFLMDDSYSWSNYQTQISEKMKKGIYGTQKQSNKKLKSKKPDPFFSYFIIYRNILFIISPILSYLFIRLTNIKNILNLSNPIFIFSLIFILFILEKISLFLQKKTEDKKGFIYSLHIGILEPTKLKLRLLDNKSIFFSILKYF